MYGQDEAFTVFVIAIGIVILLVCWIAEYFHGGDR
tara:strand:- start:231 stop:335 length:105 start_codon:yes stop_codon:yes gene_type:complete